MSELIGTIRPARWNQGAYDDGAEARIVHNAPLSSAPSAEVIGQWCHESWVAGWIDAVMEIMQ